MNKNADIETRAVNDLRVLAVDMIQKANSGHPGMALDAAPALYTLFAKHLVIDPSDPHWESRDRFVLSSGHVSALLYSMLYMSGYSLTLDDLKSFRQYGSRTPGHPELGVTPGVDATAGPLGQGIAQAVGIAMAEKHLTAIYPEAAGFLAHKTYVLCGDGCLEEGISHEAISLAGRLGLSNLILLYDRNGSTLDAPTSVSMDDDVALRLLASGWNVIEVKDGNDLRELDRAIKKAKSSKVHPSAVIFDTKIGYGSPLEGSHKVHGSPFKEEDYQKTRAFFGADYAPFEVPEASLNHIRKLISERAAEAKKATSAAREAFFKDFPEEAGEYQKGLRREASGYIAEPESYKSEASRATSGKIIEALGKNCPFSFGGSADVASSVKTSIPGDPGFSKEHPEGKDVYFGIREFGMASAMNGILLHGGLLPYAGCFMVFSDYLKPAIRMAAIEKLPAIYLFSHDSLAVGEDGPTHQPIEQFAMLRSIPGLWTLRPADARETYACYKLALERKDGPVALLLSRQTLPLLENGSFEGALKGAYLVRKADKPAMTVIATGSEVSLAVKAAEILKEQGKDVDVVSMPSAEVFESQDGEYKKSVLRSPYEKTVTLEMGTTFGWAKWGKINIGVDGYGASGKESDVVSAYGFTPEKVAEKLSKIK